MKRATESKKMTVQLTTQEVFDAGRAAQEQGCVSLGDFAHRAIMAAVDRVLEPVQGDARLRETGEPGPASAWRVASEAPANRKGVTV